MIQKISIVNTSYENLANEIGVPEVSCNKRKKALQYGSKIHKTLLKTR